MNKNVKVSVIIPSYNHSQFIEKTINSVLNQTFDDFEIIVVDDSSTDNSTDKIDSIKDNRLKKFYLNENVGTVIALNFGLSKATGEYIATLGSDDIWEKDKLEKQVKILENNQNLGACFSWANIIDEFDQLLHTCNTINCDMFIQKNRTQGQWLRYFYENANCLCHSSALLRKKVYDEIGNYNLAYRQLHDFEYWIKLVNKYEIFIVEEPLVKYRRVEKNNNSVSGATLENTIRVFNETYNIWFDYFFSYINEKLFLDAFKDKLKNKVNLSYEQLVCEMFFVLKELNIGGVQCNALALRFLTEKLNNDRIFGCLKKRYNFNLSNFYQESGKKIRFYPEFISNHDLLNEINNLKTKYQNTINEIYSSTSWKITKPLRKISKIFRLKIKWSDKL